MAEINQFLSKDAEKQVKDLVKLMGDLAKSYETTFNQSKKLDDQIKKLSKSTDDNKKKKEQLTDIQKEEARILKASATTKAKLQKIESASNKLLIAEQQALQKRNKELKNSIALEDKSIGTRKRLRLENIKLREEREDLNLATQKGKDRLAELNTEIDKNNDLLKDTSDSLTKQKIGIGGYEDAIRAASEGNEAFSGSSTDILQNFISINQQEGGVKSFFKSFVSGISTAIKAGLKFIATPIGLAITAIVAGIAAFTAIIKRNEAAGDRFNEIWAAGTAIIDVVIDRVLKLFSAFGKLITLDFKGAAEDAAGAFDDLGESISNAAKRAVEIKRLTIEIENLNRVIGITTTQLEGQARILQIIADDATRSFKEREDAAEKERGLNQKIADQRFELAQKQFKLVNLELIQALEAGKANRALRQSQADALKELIQAENDALAIQLENEKTRSELVQDRLERDLDILIDGFDNVKTINERIIADDTKTFDERAKLFNQTIDLAKKSFDAQIDIIKKFTKVRFDENELIAEQDAVILNERIRQLGLSEIIEGRLLEIIRDRRTAVQDLVDVQRDLTKEMLSGFGSFEKIQRDQILAIQDEIIEGEEKVTDKYLEELDKRIKAHKDSNKIIEDETVTVLDKIKEKLEEVFGEEYAAIIGGAIQLGTELFKGFQETRKQQLSDESNALELQRQTALEGVKGQKDKEAQINDQFNRKQAVIKQRQWKAEQNAALFQIAIQTSVNAVKGFPALTVLALLLGATQAAFVKAQKPPKFAKGSKGLQKDTHGIVGEAGRELLFMPGGGVALAEKKTEGVWPKGTVIKTNRETEQILAANQLKASRENDVMSRDYSELRMLGDSLAEDRKSILKAVENQNQYSFNVSVKAIKAFMKNKSGVTTYLNNRLP